MTKFGVEKMKKIIALAVILLFGFGLTGCSLFSPGTTTTTVTTTVDTDNFIQINSVDDLQNIELNKSYILESDLDLTGIEWKPIGNIETPYLGIFDGNGHTISNMSITNKNYDFNGLFGYVQGTIKNLNVANFNITYTTNFLTYAGGISGYIIGDVLNNQASGTINIINTAGNTFAGLLAGLSQAYIDSTTTVDNFKTNILDGNIVSGDISVNPTGYAFVGGLCGMVYNSEVLNNQASGTINVSGGDDPIYIGGLLGRYYGGILIGFENQVDSTDIHIQNNITNEDITVIKGDNGASIGGFIGYTQYGIFESNASLSNITASGDTLYVGGFIGENWNTSLTNILVDSTVNVTVTDTAVYELGTIIGKNFTDSQINTAFYVFASSNTTVANQGTEASFANFQDTSWLQNSFGWNQDFSTKISTITNS